ncbi:MAG: 3-hydroxybutyryl-CoA dehydrogenase, partial [candidate division Zixibacteria bacterium]|nr:3-hydroxybutyryl-CoA dehydrogenase [candidate division Zixibacteria bacterium]
MTIHTVGVAGCGLMGGGIAQVTAQAGYQTIVREASDELLRRGLGRIEAFLAGNVAKGKITEVEKTATLSRLSGTTDFRDFGSCDLVIEAVTENIEVKKEVFATIDRIVPAHTILASNTSSISITALAGATKRPTQVIGLHFFNPVPVMKLIEMVIGLETDAATVATAREFGTSLGKQVIEAKDTPGFIVNYLL